MEMRITRIRPMLESISLGVTVGQRMKTVVGFYVEVEVEDGQVDDLDSLLSDANLRIVDSKARVLPLVQEVSDECL